MLSIPPEPRARSNNELQVDCGELCSLNTAAIVSAGTTMNMDRDVAAEAFRFGASGYLVKSSAGAELVQAIRQT